MSIIPNKYKQYEKNLAFRFYLERRVKSKLHNYIIFFLILKNIKYRWCVIIETTLLYHFKSVLY